MRGRNAFESVRPSSPGQSADIQTVEETVNGEKLLRNKPSLLLSIDVSLNDSRAKCVVCGQNDKETLYNLRKVYHELSKASWWQKRPIGIKFYRVMPFK